jgi:hypothetical protein
MTAPNVARSAVLAACADMIRACGLTLAELADELAKPAPSAPPLRMLPMAGEVDIDAVHAHQPAPTVETKARALTHNDRRVIDAADSPKGTTVNGVMDLLGVQEAQAHRICSLLADSHHLIRVKKPGIRAMHFFARPADALAWHQAQVRHEPTAQSAPDIAPVPAPEPEPAPAPAIAPAPFPEAAPAAAPTVAGLSADELRSVEIHAAIVAGSKMAPPPMGKRTPKPAPHQALTITPPKIDDTKLRPAGEAITTEKTRTTRDTTERPTAKWQTQDLPPDPRYPSFSSMRPGTDPRTGKEWGARA